MKTKSIVVALVMAVSVAAFGADPVGPKVVVVNQKESGLFKVIYEGVQTGKVTMKIYNNANEVVFAETVNGVDGFIRPVNFSGMTPGEYTIEVADASGKQIQKVEYTTAKSINVVHVAKLSNQGKYLLAVANKGTEEINVRIFDGNNTLIHNEDLTVSGELGLVYNLKNVSGVPTFEVTSKATGAKVIK